MFCRFSSPNDLLLSSQKTIACYHRVAYHNSRSYYSNFKYTGNDTALHTNRQQQRNSCHIIIPTTKTTTSRFLQKNNLSCNNNPTISSRKAVVIKTDYYNRRYYASTTTATIATPGSGSLPNTNKKMKKKFIPPKAVLSMTPKSRTLFKGLLSNVSAKDVIGIMLKFQQSTSGEPRMVFLFQLVTKDDITEDAESVSLEVLEDGITPAPHRDSINDGLPKLYVHSDALMKVLGTTVDVDEDGITPLVFDPEGNIVDPNY